MQNLGGRKDHKKRILVVDESITIQKLVNVTFAGDSYEVITAYDGLDADHKIKRMKPDLVLVDAGLRDMGGPKLCEEIRSDSQLSGIRVILMSGNLSVDQQERIASLPVDAVLEKPFDSKVLHKEVNRLLSEDESTVVMSKQSSAPPAKTEGPFSSFRMAENNSPPEEPAPQKKDPLTRLEAVAAEIAVEDTGAAEADDEPSTTVKTEASSKEPKAEIDREMIGQMIDEKLNTWMETKLPEIAEKLIKEEITRLTSK